MAGPEVTGLLAAIGIEKGKPFAPDAWMRRVLEEAAAIGNGAARSLTQASRDPEPRIYPAASG